MSVIIPVKNGAETLERCLRSIRSQTFTDLEIIVLDSMSTDNSRMIAASFGASIIEIHAGTFNHGLTRNTGAQSAGGDLLYLTVQDASIAEPDMLEKMVAHFEDENVMGVVGHQAVPHEKDKNPYVWFRRFSEPLPTKRTIEKSDDIERFDHRKQRSLIAWDNVVSMYRASALKELPFAETQFAEDWIWSKAALMRGWTLIHDPRLIVYHYHHQSYKFAYDVAYAVNYHFYKFFGFLPSVPNLFNDFPKAIYHLGKNEKLSLKEKMYWAWYNFRLQLGTFNSHINFLWHHKIGGAEGLEKRYNKVCKTVPQGKQKKQ